MSDETMIYVLSDIHGNLKRFESIMKQINLQADDTLYVLGDVVDRFPDGIKILRRIMRMKNAKMLLGNHEKMMLKAIENCYDPINNKLDTERSEVRHWYLNGGEVTYKQLIHYRKETRAEILDFIRQLPLNFDVEINNIKYKLVHASPVENFTPVSSSGHKYESVLDFAVWDRWDETKPVPAGYVLIFGHTPTDYFYKKESCGIWKNDVAIGIDCACGYDSGRLLCLRLDDMKEFYSDC